MFNCHQNSTWPSPVYELDGHAFNLEFLGLSNSSRNNGSLFENKTFEDLSARTRFQYSLIAQTSAVSKVQEESVTYLNQGQLYEVQLKKSRGLDESDNGMFYRCVIKVVFDARKLRCDETQLFKSWSERRPGERIIDIDFLQSDGCTECKIDRALLNQVEFIWDPSKDARIFIKVNCIGSEFTAKKHGGETGVLFRIEIETYECGVKPDESAIYCASCQVKVYKLKGAERKHTNDKNKLKNKTQSDLSQYRHQSSITTLTEMQIVKRNQPTVDIKHKIPQKFSNDVDFLLESLLPSDYWSNLGISYSSNPVIPTDHNFKQSSADNLSYQCSPANTPSSLSTSSSNCSLSKNDSLSRNSTVDEVAQWLIANRFTDHLEIFKNYDGIDMLKLSKQDLTDIMPGKKLPDAIRLFNALIPRPRHSTMTFFDRPASCESDESMLRIKESASPGWSQGSPFSGTESVIPSPNSRDSSSPQSFFPSFPSFPISRKRLTSEDNKIGEVDLKKYRGSSDVKCKAEQNKRHPPVGGEAFSSAI